MRRYAWLSVCGLGLMACTPASQTRAELDEPVGHVEADGLVVDVRDGLATVLDHQPDAVRLWLSAPDVRVRLDSDVARTVTLALWNTMADATAVVDGQMGELEDTGIPTRKELVVDVPAGETTIRIAPADADDRTPWEFALMSDVQGGIDEVQDVFATVSAEPSVRFLLGAGDLSSTGSREELERFRTELETMAVPYYTTLGNHDAPIAGMWQELYGRGNFRFVYRGVQFTLLDSASATIDPLAYTWLDGWLTEGLSRVHVFAMHIPALDPVGTRNGALGSRNEAGKLLSKLHAGNVSLTLYGHIHSFYQFENGGIQAFISGGGGAFDEKGDGFGRHFVVFEAGADAGIVGTRIVHVD